MPHATHTRNLGRFSSWRKATVRSLVSALLRHERIRTTHARAKETQRLAERLITLGKSGSLSDRRRALSLLNDPSGVAKLFSEVAPRFASRAGGYTRILHTGYRAGDGASMSVLELVEIPAPKEKKPKKPAAEVSAPKPEKPVKEAKKPEERKPESPKKKPEEKKPEGFFEGLRKFFKKDRPGQP